MKCIYIRLIFLMLIALVSCTTETKPTTGDIVISNRFDSVTRALDKLNVKVETMPLSLQSISEGKVNMLIATAVKVPNDKIAAQAITIAKLVADTSKLESVSSIRISRVGTTTTYRLSDDSATKVKEGNLTIYYRGIIDYLYKSNVELRARVSLLESKLK